jgi:hypothetical protein
MKELQFGKSRPGRELAIRGRSLGEPNSEAISLLDLLANHLAGAAVSSETFLIAASPHAHLNRSKKENRHQPNEVSPHGGAPITATDMP